LFSQKAAWAPRLLFRETTAKVHVVLAVAAPKYPASLVRHANCHAFSPQPMLRIFNQLVSAKVFVLVQTEALLILLCFLSAARLWFWNDPAGFARHAKQPDFLIQCLVLTLLLQICFYCNDLYAAASSGTWTEQLIGLVRAIGTLCIISAGLYFLAPLMMIRREVLILALALTLVVASFARLLLDKAWRATAPSKNLIVLGTGSLAKEVALEVRRRNDLSLSISAFAAKDPSASQTGAGFMGHPVVSLFELERDVPRFGISQIVVALEDRRGTLPVADLVRLRVRGVAVVDARDLLSALSGRVQLDTVAPSGFIFGDGFRRSKITLIWKRALDVTLGLLGLLLTAPIMALTTIIVFMESGGPVLYKQTRVGLKGREFRLLKFRSMRVDAESNGEAQWTQLGDPRITRFGAFLRAYHLDELPQFINVVRGEMSFVGPRPERPCFVEQLRMAIPFYEERHVVRPGVTGWAQVQYPYGATIAEAARKLEYDLFYLKNMSFAFDCAIVLRTLRTVFLAWGSR
jgi:sugar transferase (PEP-CTERM system associated)